MYQKFKNKFHSSKMAATCPLSLYIKIKVEFWGFCYEYLLEVFQICEALCFDLCEPNNTISTVSGM